MIIENHFNFYIDFFEISVIITAYLRQDEFPNHMIYSMMETEYKMPEIKLYDTYFSEIKKKCKLSFNEPAVRSGYSRSYYTGSIEYGDFVYDVKLIKFDSGNVQILCIKGENTEPFLSMLNDHKKKHCIPLMLRRLCQYVYYLASPVVGATCFWFLIHGMWFPLFKGFLLLTVFRFFYTEGRNYLS